MAKRKAERNAVEKHSKTPKKNIEQTDFTAEFAREENPMKGFNRNSKRGREGKHNERPIE
ncbi:hypothetical protein OEV82_15640 [Caldibacillus thermolactis]|jgi:hypothetical protein|uniref:Glycogen biosynthesis protein GlgD n=1 Tax=Pallidibacillus thermolactis TaxID=251051 RepID=A0ABT2WJG6_9BACI|nr:hypothetical protein [Pallidibacillus thermolactis]MCU9595837.1 hypothetical protein [Pallidibacillus thermolactis]MCU9602629.1 hypothetical protein [Pallidibacillus thermolactis subsp. kokeshiiformis]MED1675035.1 hypothetical protein [Pallidibacillus thermolactis subsp. kokeshiiformis]